MFPIPILQKQTMMVNKTSLLACKVLFFAKLSSIKDH